MAKKEISHQKKFETRIDFTPMVDMNMLLITFFMLCTTMLKSQTLKIALPSNSNESKQEQNQNQAAESQAFTIIIDGVETEKDGNFTSDRSKSKFYYYEGKLVTDPATTNFKSAAGIASGPEGKDIIRKLLMDKNKEALKLINELKGKWEKNEFAKNEEQNDSIYQVEVNKVLVELNAAHKTPIVMIKPTSRACYADVIAALDEMQINHIGTFQIETLSKDDSTALANAGVQLPPPPAPVKKKAAEAPAAQ